MIEELKYLRERSTEQDEIIIDLQRTIKQQQEETNSLKSTVAELKATNDKDGLISSPEPEVSGKYRNNIYGLLKIKMTFLSDYINH